jgi:hypothetical protein
MEPLFPAIAKLIDLLLRLAEISSGRRKELFQRVFDPMFDQLLIIHKDYIELFNKSLETLPTHIEGEGWVDKDFKPTDTLAESFRANVRDAKRSLMEGRESYEAERIRMRALAHTFFNKKLKQEEKRFVWSIVCYFLTPERRVQSNDFIDMQIEILEGDTGVRTLDTPALSAASVVSHETDPKRIRTILTSAKINQLEKWTDVCRLYGELKSQIILKA